MAHQGSGIGPEGFFGNVRPEARIPFPDFAGSTHAITIYHVLALDDIGHALASHNCPGVRTTLEVACNLAVAAFNGWDTNAIIPVPPKREPEKLDGALSRTQIGVFAVDLPEPAAQQKERKRLAKTAHPMGPYVPDPSRKQGAPAFFRPVLNSDTYLMHVQAIDRDNKMVNAKPEHISFLPEYAGSEARAFATAAINFDRETRRQYGQFNTRWAVYFVRLRMRDWAHSPGLFPRRKANSPEDFSIFKTPELNSDRSLGWLEAAYSIYTNTEETEMSAVYFEETTSTDRA